MADIPAVRGRPSVDLRWKAWFRGGRTLSSREHELVFLVLAEIFVAHLLFGANRNDLALGLAFVQAALLLRGLMLPSARQVLRLKGTPLLFGLYAATLALVATGLIPREEPRLFSAFPWLASPTASIDPDATLVALVRMAGLGCVFVQGMMIGVSRARSSFFMKAFVVLATLYAAASIIGFWIAPETLYGLDRAYHADRLGGSFLSANSAGAFFGMALLACLGLISTKGRASGLSPANLATGLAATVLALALLLTASRGALAATAAAVLVLMLARRAATRRRPGAASFLMALAGMLVVVGAAVLLSPISERFLAAPGDVHVRLAIVGAHWPAIQSELWQGYGAGAFDRINAMVQTPATVDRLWSVRALHNVYLQWLEEVGLLGSLPVWAALGLVLRSMISSVLSNRPVRWAGVVLAMSVVLLMHGIVDYSLEVPSLSGEWALMLGIGYASAIGRRRLTTTVRRALPVVTRRILRLRTGVAAVSASATLVLAGGALASAVQDATSPTPPPHDAATLRAAALRSPADGQGWLFAAIAEQDGANACGRTCAADLARSYQAAPLARPIFPWRTRFALEHWDELPAPVREAALRHVLAQWGTRAGRRDIQSLTKVVANPSGRLAITLVRQELDKGQKKGATD